jgi:peptidoglycan/xylan/chitin deacetylase (PgdA/CDA1 family)
LYEVILRFVSPALKHIVFPVLSRSGYLRRSVGAGPAVVTYHGVFPPGYEVRNAALDGNLVRADSLRRQLRLLKKRYHVIVPEEFLSWSDGQTSLPPRSILLTCDDALQNTLTEMVPVLRELDLSCLFFATGASAYERPSMLWYEELYLMLLDASEPVALNLSEAGFRVDRLAAADRHARWWDLVQKLSRFDRQKRSGFLNQAREQLRLPNDWGEQFVQNPVLASRFLTLDGEGLRLLAGAGMTIGAHSLSHPVLARAPNDLAWREISESRSVLEKALGRTIWAFGYPFGNVATVTMRDVRMAEQAGFRCAFMNAGGGFGAKIDPFTVPRVHVTAEMTPAEFEAHLTGFYRSLRRRLLRRSELQPTMGA